MAQQGGTASASFLAEIMAGVAAIVPGEVAPPDQKRNPDEEILYTCDEYLRQLYGYHSTLVAAEQPLMDEAKRLKREVVQAMLPERKEPGDIKTMEDLLGSLFTPMSKPGPEERAKIERVKEIEKMLAKKAPSLNLVGALFWIEARRRAPTEVSAVGLRSDWSVVDLSSDKGDSLERIAAELEAEEAGVRQGRN